MPTSIRRDHNRASQPGARISVATDDRADAIPVDVRETESLLSAVNDDMGLVTGRRSGSSRRGGHKEHGLVAVGPAVPGPLLLGGRAAMYDVNPLPVHGARIHRPPLRADVLSRPRLNDRLEDAARGRLALIVAEAGFGKTTLLADWARQTRRLVAWYRLESDDRDWLTFIRHLIAGGRELDPDFAPETYALLLQLGPGGPTQGEILSSLAAEYATFASSKPAGVSLVFDDYQAIDGCDETEPIVRALLDQTGHGFSIVIATRSTPSLPLGRLRARSAISRLDGDALNFDVPETDRLFSDAYHQPLDPDVVTDLVARTEGWAALLSLVHTNLEESRASGPRDPRLLVRELSGAQGDLYDYLAEEVVDRLAPDLSQLLLRTSILDEIDVDVTAFLIGQSISATTEQLGRAEQLGLLLRRDRDSGFRCMPLLREFLESRLMADLGPKGVAALYATVAKRFETERWRVSAIGYIRSGDALSGARVIMDALDEILGRGEYRPALELLSRDAEFSRAHAILESRVLLQIGAVREALSSADLAISATETQAPSELPRALLNATSVAIAAREHELALGYAERVSRLVNGGQYSDLVAGYLGLLGVAGTANLPALASQLKGFLADQRRTRRWHHAAITALNLAQVLVWLGQPDEALELASESAQHFGRSSHGYESVSLALVAAQAQAQMGDWHRASDSLRAALGTSHPAGFHEAVLEAASLASWFGPPEDAAKLLSRARRESLPVGWASHWLALDLWIEEDEQKRERILSALPAAPPPSIEVGAAFRWHLAVARCHMLAGRQDLFAEAIEVAMGVAAVQGSSLQVRIALLARAVGSSDSELSALIEDWPAGLDPLLGIYSRELCQFGGRFTPAALMVIERAARSQSHRWLGPLRTAIEKDSTTSGTRSASILELIGEAQDITRLRDFSRRARRTGHIWGDALIERLAPRVMIEDLGHLSMKVGERALEPGGIRRKVMALLAFLITQPGGSATPDQILEALWPDLDPEQGTNSIHQTIYFLRRAIDPDYRAGMTAEYLHYESEVVWLDRGLVDCRSWSVRRLMSARPTDRNAIEAIAHDYVAKFAIDFAYEDWAAGYRDSLHASYLALMERALTGHVLGADEAWRLWVGQQVLAVDPEADEIEAEVIRLYRSIGAPSAAAEQYAHYVSQLRDHLGIEPPRLNEL